MKRFPIVVYLVSCLILCCIIVAAKAEKNNKPEIQVTKHSTIRVPIEEGHYRIQFLEDKKCPFCGVVGLKWDEDGYFTCVGRDDKGLKGCGWGGTKNDCWKTLKEWQQITPKQRDKDGYFPSDYENGHDGKLKTGPVKEWFQQ